MPEVVDLDALGVVDLDADPSIITDEDFEFERRLGTDPQRPGVPTLDRNQPPANAPSIGPAPPGSAREPSTPPEALDRAFEAFGSTGARASTSRTLEEEPFNESDVAALGRGARDTAMTAALPFGAHAALGSSAARVLATLGVGTAGAVGGEKVGRAVGEQVGAPEMGSLAGETAGGYLGGRLGAEGEPPEGLKAALARAAQLARGSNLGGVGRTALDMAAVAGVPGTGRAAAVARILERAGGRHAAAPRQAPAPAAPAVPEPPPSVGSTTGDRPPTRGSYAGRTAKAAGQGREFKESPTTDTARVAVGDKAAEVAKAAKAAAETKRANEQRFKAKKAAAQSEGVNLDSLSETDRTTVLKGLVDIHQAAKGGDMKVAREVLERLNKIKGVRLDLQKILKGKL